MSKLLVAISVILLLQIISVSAQTPSTAEVDCSAIKYEDHNFLPPERLTVSAILGRVLLQSSQVPINEICIGLFNEKTKKLVKVTFSNKDGEFSFEGVKNGKYRLIVFDEFLFVCTANIPVEIKRKIKKQQRIAIKMVRYGLIDVCSYGEII